MFTILKLINSNLLIKNNFLGDFFGGSDDSNNNESNFNSLDKDKDGVIFLNELKEANNELTQKLESAWKKVYGVEMKDENGITKEDFDKLMKVQLEQKDIVKTDYENNKSQVTETAIKQKEPLKEEVSDFDFSTAEEVAAKYDTFAENLNDIEFGKVGEIVTIKTNLNLRDENLKRVGGINKGENVILTGEQQLNKDGKVFIEVNHDNNKYYVSADYVEKVERSDGDMIVEDLKTGKVEFIEGRGGIKPRVDGAETNVDEVCDKPSDSDNITYGEYHNSSEYVSESGHQKVHNAVDSLGNLRNMVEKTSPFYKGLEAYVDGGERNDIISDMGGLNGWIREASGKNNPNEYMNEVFTSIDTTSENFNKEKYNSELINLLPTKEFSYLDENGYEYSQGEVERDESMSLYGIRDAIILLSLKDISVFDVRLTFAQSLQDLGIPMDKALAFSNWVESGMEGKPDYSEENLKEISGESALRDLADVRHEFEHALQHEGLTAEEIKKAVSGDFSSLSQELKLTILSIYEKRIIPDLITLNEGGFNWLEKFFDSKDNKVENIINKLQGKKHILDVVAQNDNMFTIEKINGKYIMETTGNTDPEKNHGRYGAYKVFEKYPSESEINNAVSEYDKGVYNGKGWDFSILTVGVNDETSDISVDYYKISENEYVAVHEGKYQVFDHKPTQDDIMKYFNYINVNFEKNIHDGGVDSNLTIEQQAKMSSQTMVILKEQDKEGRWFGDNEDLDGALEATENRMEYTNLLKSEKDFLDSANKILDDSSMDDNVKLESLVSITDYYGEYFECKEMVDFSKKVYGLDTPTLPILGSWVKKLSDSFFGKGSDNGLSSGNAGVGGDTGGGIHPGK